VVSVVILDVVMLNVSCYAEYHKAKCEMLSVKLCCVVILNIAIVNVPTLSLRLVSYF
jgi:hypothetical protein